tara:strand:+ start:2707 stop:3435 length:729 start_codon:yes stop_codon:yes gene_type:complete
MTTEIAIKQTKTDVAEFKNHYKDFVINIEDLPRPEIKLMQKTSQKVEEELAKIGEFRDTVENKLFGDKKNSMVVVPVAPIEAIWCEELYDDKDNKVQGGYRETPRRGFLPKSEPHPEGTLYRKAGYRLLCMPMSEIEANYKHKTKVLPYSMLIKGSSKWSAGDNIIKEFAKLVSLKKMPYELAIEIISVLDNYNGNTFYKMLTKSMTYISDKEKLEYMRELSSDMSSFNSVKKDTDNNEQFF